MNKKQEKEFVNLVNKIEDCKVKFELENAGGATYESGICKEILTWAVFFDDNFISQFDPPEDLLDCVRDYLIWSSQRIRELEAKLALASLFNEKEKESLPKINTTKLLSKKYSADDTPFCLYLIAPFFDSQLILDSSATITVKELYDNFCHFWETKNNERVQVHIHEFEHYVIKLLAEEDLPAARRYQGRIPYIDGLRIRDQTPS
jgi:hypothetical protein